jgi:hypothetical protein
MMRRTEAAPVLIPGVRLAMGGREWTVPPLTLGQLRRLEGLLNVMRGINGRGNFMDEGTIDAVVAIVGAALRRNYPEVDDDQVADLLDLGNAGTVLAAVLISSGLRERPSGPEDQAARADGTSSTGSSPPASATGPATSTS